MWKSLLLVLRALKMYKLTILSNPMYVSNVERLLLLPVTSKDMKAFTLE
jgi:hypothetical protein